MQSRSSAGPGEQQRAPGNLWERKKRATRRTLQEVTLRLAIERGLENLTIEEISSAADVSPRTFSNYFSSKEDALTGDGPGMFNPEELAAFAAGGRSTDLLAEIHDLLARSIEPAAGRWPEMRQRRQLLERYPVLMARLLGRFARLEDDLTGAIAQRTGADTVADPGPRMVAAVAITALRVAFLRWTEQDAGRSLAEHLSEVFGVLRRTV